MTFEFTGTGVAFGCEPVKPYVGDNGIYVPAFTDHRHYQCLITKELFVEAYNKWIGEEKKTKRNPINFGEDTADEWCE